MDMDEQQGFPSVGLQRGWEIRFEPGNPNQLLTDLLHAVPDGAVLLIEDDLEAADREAFWPYRVYWTRGKWSYAETMAVGVFAESRAAILDRICAVNLERRWIHIRLFRGSVVFFESHDYIRTNAFVTDAVDASTIQNWVANGTVTAADRFVPEKV